MPKSIHNSSHSTPASRTQSAPVRSAAEPASPRALPLPTPPPIAPETSEVFEPSPAPNSAAPFTTRHSFIRWGGRAYKIWQKVDPSIDERMWQTRVKTIRAALKILETDPNEEANLFKPGHDFDIYMGDAQLFAATLQNNSQRYPIPMRIDKEEEPSSIPKTALRPIAQPRKQESANLPQYPIPLPPATLLPKPPTQGVVIEEIETPKPPQPPVKQATLAAKPIHPIANIRFARVNNNCFINAAVQLLFCDPFVRGVFKEELQELLRQLDQLDQLTEELAVKRQVYELTLGVIDAYNNPPDSLDLTPLKSALQKINKQNRSNNQEDANQYYRYLLDCLPDDNPLSACIQQTAVALDSDDQIIHRSRPSEVLTAYAHLSLKFSKQNRDFEQALKQAIFNPLAEKPERHSESGISFDATHGVTQYVARPRLLSIHLERVEVESNLSAHDQRKNQEPILNVPLRLYLQSNYLIANDPEAVKTSYFLSGYTQHLGGGAQQGHYIAYLRIAQKGASGNPIEDAYFRIDDDISTPISAVEFSRNLSNASTLQYIASDARDEVPNQVPPALPHPQSTPVPLQAKATHRPEVSAPEPPSFRTSF